MLGHASSVRKMANASNDLTGFRTARRELAGRASAASARAVSSAHARETDIA